MEQANRILPVRIEYWEDIRELVVMTIGTDKGAWWANPAFGSRLFEIRQAGKVTPQTAGTLQQLLQEALSWMKEDGIAAEIICLAERTGKNEIAYTVTVVRPKGDPVMVKDVWNALN
jgi:phage gp46-like protein